MSSTGAEERGPLVPAPLRRAGRKLPPIAWRDARIAELDREVVRLRRAAARRGPGLEKWNLPTPGDAARLIRDSGLFDEAWYLSQIDHASAPADPIAHYVASGAAAGLSPHPAFVGSWYAARVLEIPGYGSPRRIAAAPLLHYLTVGAQRQISPHPAFDPEAYVEEVPESAAERFGPLAHFLADPDGSCLSVVPTIEPAEPGLITPQRRTRDQFLADARVWAAAMLDTRGYLHLEREHDEFDRDAEARLKAELRASAATLGSLPLVSVVLPTKDRAEVVGSAIESVLNQTYRNLELLVVDDGSGDDTPALLERYASDPRLVVISHDHARGVAAARNAALDRATGELVAYLDSDNTWLPDFLELIVAFLVRENHRVAYAMSELVSSKSGQQPTFRGMAFSRGAMLERNYIDCIVLVHERALLEETGAFDETLRRNVDWDLFIRMARVTDFGFLPVIATQYDVWDAHSDRISTEEPSSYRQVVRQRSLLDWDRVRATADQRSPDLVSLVVAATDSAVVTATSVRRAMAAARGAVEVVVVDVHMPDGESTLLRCALSDVPEVRIHRLTQPDTSVEVARNVGASLTTGGTLVFLAEDGWCEPGWDTTLASALAEHSAVQPVVLDRGGAIWSAGLFLLPGGETLNLHQGLAGDAPEARGTRRVDAASSACVAVRADEFAEVGGFDPLFNFHLTGGDLSTRLEDRFGRPAGCAGGAQVALRGDIEAGNGARVAGLGGRRDNGRLQRERFAGRSSVLDATLGQTGLGIAGVHQSAASSQPCSGLLVRERAGRPLRWAIKIGAPSVAGRESWGDTHFAEALRDALESLGHEVTIDCKDSWYRPTTHLDDVTLVLRGLSQYHPNPEHTNLVWVISHPDRVIVRELETYDLVFGASSRWCDRVARRTDIPVELLLQCTDERRFHPVPPDPERRHDLLAVANARGVRPSRPRASVAAALAAGLTPAVYGQRWGGLLPDGAWKGSYLPNADLPAVYTAAGAVLNDHWDDMRAEGLLSNRLFDLAACDARIISDHLPEIADVFGDVVLTYREPADIPDLLAIHQDETEERRLAREELGARVRRDHTFTARARTLSARVDELRAAAVATRR